MKKFKIEFKWALIFTIASLLWMYFEKTMGWHGEHIEQHPIYTNLFGIVAIVIYVFALRDKRANFYNGIMDWKQGFLSGAILSIIIAAITPLAQYVAHTYISPQYFENMIAYSVKNNIMKIEAAENYFVLSKYMFMSAFFALSVGIVTAAVVAWFLKSKPKIEDR